MNVTRAEFAALCDRVTAIELALRSWSAPKTRRPRAKVARELRAEVKHVADDLRKPRKR